MFDPDHFVARAVQDQQRPAQPRRAFFLVVPVEIFEKGASNGERASAEMNFGFPLFHDLLDALAELG
jgi:hypothetical protein